MELPSTRELELEALARQRDGQVAELNVSLLFERRRGVFSSRFSLRS
jgi:hypothetical protein